MDAIDDFEELGQSIRQRYEEWTLSVHNSDTEAGRVLRFLSERLALIWSIQTKWGGSQRPGAYTPIAWTGLASSRRRSLQKQTTPTSMASTPPVGAGETAAPTASKKGDELQSAKPAVTPAPSPHEEAPSTPVFLTNFVAAHNATPLTPTTPGKTEPQETQSRSYVADAKHSTPPEPMVVGTLSASAPQTLRRETAATVTSESVEMVHPKVASPPDPAPDQRTAQTKPSSTMAARGPQPEKTAAPGEEKQPTPTPVNVLTFPQAPAEPVSTGVGSLPHPTQHRFLPPISEVVTTSPPATNATAQPQIAKATLSPPTPGATAYASTPPGSTSVQQPGALAQPSPDSSRRTAMTQVAAAQPSNGTYGRQAGSAEPGRPVRVEYANDTASKAAAGTHDAPSPGMERDLSPQIDDAIERTLKSLVRRLGVEAERRGITQWR